MNIYSNNIHAGYLDDAFGHRGSQFIKSKPSRSFHVAWQDLPAQTQSLALTFLDYDAVPVCGFPWIHWTVANIDPAWRHLPENASIEMPLLEGVTSWNSGLLDEEWYLSKEEATGFGGSAPPDKAHLYTLTLYALDTTLHLNRGFYMNELWQAMDGHILDQATLQMWYKSKEEYSGSHLESEARERQIPLSL